MAAEKGRFLKSALGLGIVVVLAGSLVVLGARESGKGPGDSPSPKKDPKDEPKTTVVTINGKPFTLELAIEPQVQFKGLGGRTEIKSDGGMLFVFAKPEPKSFVMRDCPIAIDIIYLDAAGRVVATYKMTPEPARSEAEKKLSPPYAKAPEWQWTNDDYEERLKKYPSGFAAQYVIELKGDTLDTLKVNKGDKVDLDIAALKKRLK
ncbi:MAG: DUF192 domain-containing protein [Phycisphaerales bacterium]